MFIVTITTDMYIRTLSGEQHLFEANLHRGPYSLAKSVACTACGCTNLNIVEDGKYKFTNVCSECSAELSHSIVYSDFPEASQMILRILEQTIINLSQFSDVLDDEHRSPTL